MLRWTKRLAAIACALGAASACTSRTKADATVSADTASAAVSDGGDTSLAAPLDCNKVFSPADAAGLLKAPVTLTAIDQTSGWCNFTNEAVSDITVRTGSNEDMEAMWNAATVSSDRVKYVPLPGVGDQAVRKASDGAEVDSRSGKLYCVVSIAGIDDYKRLSAEELAKRLGALCAKVFAAR